MNSFVFKTGILLLALGSLAHAQDRAKRMTEHYQIESISAPANIDPQVGALTALNDGRLAVFFHHGQVEIWVPQKQGWQHFAEGLHDLLYGSRSLERRFSEWLKVVASLPRKQTRVLTWPVVTVFGFIAQPETHIFLKPMVTRAAARAYGFEFHYASRPNWNTYASLLEFGARVRRDQRKLKPRDMIDIQSFIWVQGSDEY